MRSPLFLAAAAFLTLGLAACGNSTSATATKKGPAIIDRGTTVKKDAGSSDSSGDDVAAKAGAVGEACAGDAQCTDGICFEGKCAAPCKASAECGTAKDCASDNGKRLFCHVRSYPDGVGSDCSLAGSPCAAGQKCIGNPEAPNAACSVKCKGDVDCPPTMACMPQGDGATWCQPRKFCTACASDEQCGPGAVCADMGKGKFCSKLCNSGSTECPRYADCQMVGGLPMCVHRAGTCAGTGDLCQPCSDRACNGGECLTVPSTLETFCAKDCKGKTDTSCGAGYACNQVSADSSAPWQCTPDTIDAKTPPTCVGKLTPTMNENDIMEDFAMLGYVDTNDNISLKDEAPHLIHLSDFADRKLIAVTISAGWCVPCQQETTTFANTMQGANYEVMIFQILVDGPVPNTTPTLAFSKDWVTQFNAAGASGIDLSGIANSWNEAGSIPMNMVIDAKTRQVYKKFNGSPPGGWTPTLKYYLQKYYPEP